MAENYYKTTESSGRPLKAYYYDNQLRKYVLQFMAIFTGLQVKIGKRKTGDVTTEVDCEGDTTDVPVVEDDRLISVPIHYAHQDRVVAAIINENTQNKMLRLPVMSAYVRSLDLLKNYQAGIGVEERFTYLKTGGLLPDDARVVHRRRPFPFELTMELYIYASNTDQHFQILEQILMVFDPQLQIQISEGIFDLVPLTHVELTGTTLNTNFPSGTDKRIVQSMLTFKMPIWIQTPADVRKDFVEKIYARIGAVANANADSFEIVAELDAQGINYELLFSADDLTFK